MSLIPSIYPSTSLVVGGRIIVMKKWLEEKILIKYWTENCSKYSLKNGIKIKSTPMY